MVLVTTKLLICSQATVTKTQRVIPKRKFIDSLRLHVTGGPGGSGLPRYGGIGGKGGDVFVEARNNYELKNIKSTWPSKRFKAGVGQDSRSVRILGEPGQDLVIPAPAGITVLSEDGRELADLNKPGDKVLVARGGKGGCPDNQYGGKKGQSQTIILDLKLIADIGLVGFPNAGKSTLLKAVSRASPKIAQYPFTTLQPQIGIMEYEDQRQISIADLPGLIEGAHLNVGMGHKFLKHVIRTQLLLFVLDIEGFRLNPRFPFRTPFETVMLLNKELELYKEDLTAKPAVLAVNKMDLSGSKEKFDTLLELLKHSKDHIDEMPEDIRPRTQVEFTAVIPIGARTALNIEHLKHRLRDIIDLHYELKRKDGMGELPKPWRTDTKQSHLMLV